MIAAPGAAAPRWLEPEEAARAGFYALLSRLYAGGPDAALLAAIAAAAPLPVEAGDAAAAGAKDAAGDLASAWDALRAASARATPEAVAQEYDELFIGVGKSEVNLHASHWLTGFMMERPLAEVRGALAGLGLERRPETSMVEDHLSALCETMRILIAGHGKRLPADIGEQKAFFDHHVAAWVFPCCDAISVCPLASFYRDVAQFTKHFLALERDSFAME
ncbi:MAG: molecular chaperone TorD family protein [Betaproteobacteria bacterium]|nr:molecular chaperone TorD family protein [Betaproteobacteria bacterium]MBK6603252.1 molecular chaperone TorD family protein [Betaproteobacteria bacterium]MBK7080309.1 molecular chaperone TorD family protein [Betaproteobacteria bacterium]MBK8687705.1 molecular chaperone TorD family protein [Betaproteobacteria bacterium]